MSKEITNAIQQVIDGVHDLPAAYEMSEDCFVHSQRIALADLTTGWGFWEQHGDLFNIMVNSGLWHPSDMVDLLLRLAWRYMHQLPFDVNKHISITQRNWRERELEAE